MYEYREKFKKKYDVFFLINKNPKVQKILKYHKFKFVNYYKLDPNKILKILQYLKISKILIDLNYLLNKYLIKVFKKEKNKNYCNTRFSYQKNFFRYIL